MQLWSEGLSHGKVFLKLHREAQKCSSKARYAKLARLCDHMSSFRAFLLKQLKLNLDASFNVLHLRVLFLHKVIDEPDNGIAPAVQELCQGEVLQLLQATSSSSSVRGEKIDADMWISGLLSIGISRLTTQWTAETIHDRLEVMCTDFAIAKDDIMEYDTANTLPSSRRMLSTLGTVLELSLRPASIRAACAHQFL